MIKQKKSQKLTALGKKRVNVYRLQNRVQFLEHQLVRQVAKNNQQALVNENLAERLAKLEQFVRELDARKKKCWLFWRK